MIAETVASCLAHHRVRYAVISHRAAADFAEKAGAACVSPAQLARPVLLRDARGYALAVIPSDRRLALDKVAGLLGRDLREATAAEAGRCFKDCEAGALPALGPAYALPTMVDEALLAQRQVCFVPGSHTELVCLDPDEFMALLPGARREYIAEPVPPADAAFASETESVAATLSPQ